MNPELNLPGFLIGQPTITVTDFLHPTTFGDPRITTPSTYSRVAVEIPIARPVMAYAVKLLLPVLCATITAALMFLLRPSWVDARTTIGITALLTIVALQITSNEDLPEVGYLTLMDKLYVCSYLLTIVSLGVVAWSTRLVELGNEAQAVRLDRRALVVLTAGYTLSVLWLLRTAMVEG